MRLRLHSCSEGLIAAIKTRKGKTAIMLLSARWQHRGKKNKPWTLFTTTFLFQCCSHKGSHLKCRSYRSRSEVLAVVLLAVKHGQQQQSLPAWDPKKNRSHLLTGQWSVHSALLAPPPPHTHILSFKVIYPDAPAINLAAVICPKCLQTASKSLAAAAGPMQQPGILCGLIKDPFHVPQTHSSVKLNNTAFISCCSYFWTGRFTHVGLDEFQRCSFQKAINLEG